MPTNYKCKTRDPRTIDTTTLAVLHDIVDQLVQVCAILLVFSSCMPTNYKCKTRDPRTIDTTTLAVLHDIVDQLQVCAILLCNTYLFILTAGGPVQLYRDSKATIVMLLVRIFRGGCRNREASRLKVSSCTAIAAQLTSTRNRLLSLLIVKLH